MGSFTLRSHQAPRPALVIPTLHRFGGQNISALMESMDQDIEGGEGPCQLVLLAQDAAQLTERKAQARRHIEGGLPAGPGIHFRTQPIQGDLAFVFTGAGSAYGSMGRELLQALPELGQRLADRSHTAVKAISAPWNQEDRVPPLQRLWASSALCQVHSILTQELLGLHPDAVIGYSSGESNSLFATGTWNDLDAMVQDPSAETLFTEEIGGQLNTIRRAWNQDVQWETWTVLAPVEEVRAVTENLPHVHLSVIHSDGDCIVAGDAAGCAQVCESIGHHRCLRLHYDLAVHVPELDGVREAWLELHRREVTPPSSTRIYSAGHGGAYTPSTEACAEAILAQANQTLDFRRVIEQAYADGVRIFIEHGPQGSCSRWIRDILGDREALVVALDRKGGGLEPLLEATAALAAAGIEVDLDALTDRIGVTKKENAFHLQFEAHPTPVDLPELPSAVPNQESPMQTMQPAPRLKPITTGSQSSAPAQL
ncbi:MAG: beta-ketoacyl synthase, partial [Myxococcota bacterium]|nr:beta-ketoacyl synthase [Myxococcota bacterium]